MDTAREIRLGGSLLTSHPKIALESAILKGRTGRDMMYVCADHRAALNHNAGTREQHHGHNRPAAFDSVVP